MQVNLPLSFFIALGLIAYSLSAPTRILTITRMFFSACIFQVAFGATLGEIAGRRFALGEFVQIITALYFLYLLVNGLKFSASFFYRYLVFLVVVSISLGTLFVPGPTDVLLPQFGVLLDDYYYGFVHPMPVTFRSDHILRIVRIIWLFPFLAIISSGLIDRKEIERLITSYAIVYLFILVLELFLKLSGNNDLFGAIWTLMNNEIYALNIASRGGLFVLTGFAGEPSYLPYALLPALIVLAYSQRSQIVFFLLICALMISGSLSAFGYSMVFLSLFLFWRNKAGISVISWMRYTLFLIIFFLIAGIIFIITTPDDYQNYIITRVFNIFILDDTIGSEAVRLNTWTYAIDGFLDRPFFGVGLGSVSVNSGLIGALASIGIIGMITWARLVNEITNASLISFPIVFFTSLFIFSYNVHYIYAIEIYFFYMLIGYGEFSETLTKSKTRSLIRFASRQV